MSRSAKLKDFAGNLGVWGLMAAVALLWAVLIGTNLKNVITAAIGLTAFVFGLILLFYGGAVLRKNKFLFVRGVGYVCTAAGFAVVIYSLLQWLSNGSPVERW